LSVEILFYLLGAQKIQKMASNAQKYNTNSKPSLIKNLLNYKY